MIVGDLTHAALAARLNGPGLRFAAGPFAFSVKSPLPEIAHAIARLYPAHPLRGTEDFIDYHVEIQPGRGLRRFARAQARFVVDGLEPFKPLPVSQAVPMLEWGLNWCISGYSQHLLMLHAASLARDERGLILCAPSGAGKSTLCAALALRGWDLLSDELALIDPHTLQLQGLARPINLKNNAIEVIRRFDAGAEFCGPYHDTTKGTISLMCPPHDSVLRAPQTRKVRWIVLPRYVEGRPATLTPLDPGEALIELADNAFNYHVQGAHGFEALARILDDAEVYRFEYGFLLEAVGIFSQLAQGAK